ncbi:hypothetical protein MMC15_001594 [Xylographa vitiligo]|nr:hypothetical protein [Xylographa vitiligo]
MPARHRSLLLFLALPALVRALPQRVQIPPASMPGPDDITAPGTSTRNEDFLAGFFQSPAVMGITVALAVSLFIASLVTIVCLMRARRSVGVRGHESNGEGNGVGGGGRDWRGWRGWRGWMGEGVGRRGGTVGGTPRDEGKAEKGGGWWRFSRWGLGAKKEEEARRKVRAEVRGRREREWEEHQFW